jgi:signal peptidase I
MKNEAASDHAAGHDAQAYQAVAREAWRSGTATAAVTGLLRLTVTSDSMRPLLRAGDVVVVQPIEPRTLRPGDVIVVQRGREWITHRLVMIDERGWHTHGDNMRYADEAVGAAEIVGRAIVIERGDQTIDLQQPHWRAIDGRINRVQRTQLRMFAALRKLGGTRSNGITRAAAALIHWPFQLAVRLLLRF